MTVRHESWDFDDDDYLPVLARAEGMRAPRYAMIDPAYVTSKEGAFRKMMKVFRPGFFAGTIANSKKVRLLPRTYTTAAIATNDTSIVVKDACLFVPNDALKIIPPSARVTVDSTASGWAAGDTATVTMNNIASVYTVVPADIGANLAETNANVAAKIIAAIANHPYFSSRISALALAGAGTARVTVLWSRDFSSLYSLTVAKTSTNGIITASAATFTPNTAIASVGAVNPVNNTLTLSAGASVSLPLGMPIGVSESFPTNLGLLSPNTPLDLLYRESQNWALWIGATVYGDRLPYWDGELARLFPQIILV